MILRSKQQNMEEAGSVNVNQMVFMNLFEFSVAENTEKMDVKTKIHAIFRLLTKIHCHRKRWKMHAFK